MITAEELTAAYQNLARLMTQAHTAARQEIDAKSELERRRLAAIADGTIDGKNAELREASARQVLADLYETCEQAERVASDAKLALDLARLEVERVRALLRLAELTVA